DAIEHFPGLFHGSSLPCPPRCTRPGQAAVSPRPGFAGERLTPAGTGLEVRPMSLVLGLSRGAG
ncbi:hypothetical protein, partial [Meiothermus taiwanensis]|uniref:hypothetical protein n=1 Tax=Meiothermus taiwanensis TaxID=172827 RepID=UPI001680623F